MGEEFSDRLREVDQATLNPIVRSMVEDEAAEVIDWMVTPVTGGATQETDRTYVIYRFAGNAQLGEKIVPWSLIMKARAGSQKVSQDPTSWVYWKREVLAYQSGLLADLPGNVVAPRCFGVVEYPGDEFWIWLEDISSKQKSTWSLDHYGVAARH